MLRACGNIDINRTGQKPGWYGVDVCDDFAAYYNWFQSKRGMPWQLPMNGCHITFLAGEKDNRVVGLDEMQPYDNEVVWFAFEPKVDTDGRSFWIDVQCPRLDEIRKELGLPKKPWGYHVTLGNLKNRMSRSL